MYLTHDGILDHIGQSQILPYLKEYSKKTKVYLVSFEKSTNIELAEKLNKYIKHQNIHWVILKYHKSIFMKIIDVIKLFFISLYLTQKYDINLVHCRSYLPTIVIYYLNFFKKIKYIFDIRDFWADEGIEIKKYKFIYRYIKKIEGKLLRDSSHIVCLTEKGKKYIFNKYKNLLNNKNITVIPCGTNFDLFNKNNLKKNLRDKIYRDLNFRGKKILLYYGSLGDNYLIDKMIYFYKSLKSNDNKWIFFFIINNDIEILKRKLKHNGIYNKDFRIINSPRNHLPYYLSLVDLSIFYYREGMRSLGCSPTKLADLFAMNIPVVTSRLLGDMDKIINYDKNKSFLIDRVSRSKIIQKVNQIDFDKSCNKIRKNSSYFDYKNGVKKYINIYNELAK